VGKGAKGRGKGGGERRGRRGEGEEGGGVTITDSTWLLLYLNFVQAKKHKFGDFLMFFKRAATR
jgi:hypothetical protein